MIAVHGTPTRFTPFGGQDRPHLQVVPHATIGVGLPPYAIAGHAQAAGDVQAGGVGGGGDPLDPVDAALVHGMVDEYPRGTRDQATSRRGGFQPAADLGVAVLGVEVEKEHTAHELVLKPAGRTLVPRLAELADQNDAAFFDLLTRDERRQLEVLLRKIVVERELKDVPTE